MNPFVLKSIYNSLGAISIGNGLWMLFFASSWFQTLPAGLEDTGPFNGHFVHDVGLVYLLVGLGGLWCAANLKQCLRIHIVITAFMTGHALIHIVEILFGQLPPSHWLIDLPLVFVPALLLVALTPRIRKLQ